MTIKTYIALLFTIIVFTIKVKAQNFLPYAQPNFCFDQSIKVNQNPVSNTKNLVVIDLNNDAKKEVIVADGINSVIRFYSFLSSGSFSFQNQLAVPGSFGNGKERAVDAGNFSPSSPPGLVFSTDSFIYVFKNLGSFAFTQIAKIPIPQHFIAREHYIKTNNFNNDALDDFYFISADSSSGPGITIIPFRNTGSSFVADNQQVIFTSSNGPLLNADFDISIADVKHDNDGKDDLMLTYSHVPDSVFFLENITSTVGTFNKISVFLPPPLSTPDYTIRTSEMADINGDGHMDFMFNGKGSTGQKLVIYTGLVPFNLSFHVDIPTLFTFDDFKLAEINNDGLLDFVGVGNFFSVSGMVVYPGNGNNVTYFNPSTTITFSSNVKTDELQLTDVDANGLNDIVFKPWKLNSDITYMIPNFSFKVDATPTVATVCSSSSATFVASSISPTGNYTWSDSTSSIIATSATLITHVAGNYPAYLNINMYTNATCVRYSDTVHVIDNSPVITLSTGNNTTACVGNIISTMPTGAASYSWSAASDPTLLNNPTFTIQAVAIAAYTITGVTANGCKGTAVLNVSLFPTNTNSIGVSKNPICAGDQVTLSMPSAISYTWSNASFSPSITVSPHTSSSYSLSFTDQNNCINTTNITIDVDANCEPKIYTGINLNGNSENSFFRIDNIEKFTNNHVAIFNRWGQELFSTHHYDNISNFWPPRNHRDNLVPSTYFYIVDFGDGSEVKKGWVELTIN